MKDKFLKVLIVLFAGIISIAWLDQTADRVGEGNRLYERGKYDDALGKYTDAQINDPGSPIIYFNIADAHYKKGKYDEAVSAYERASKSDDITLEAKAYYNIGNAKYQQGKLNEALDYYKRAIELSNDPDARGDAKAVNAEAKYNHEFVEKKIKEQMNKQKEQQQKDKSQQEEKQENKSQNPNEEKNKEDQPASGGQKESEQQEPASGGQKEQPESKEKKEDQQSTSDRHSDDSGKVQEQNAAHYQHEKREMSKEEAERVLEALGRSEKDARKWMAERRHALPGRVEKDW